tara:strand:+ start:4841 stop:5149 length:309 start_codon:yes stop_codon:yes gene_type:complete
MSTRSAIGLAVILIVAVMYLTGSNSAPISKIETTGVASIPTSSQLTTVNHGLGQTPSHISAQEITDHIYRMWVSDITATSFKINIDQTNTGSQINFVWKATE